VTSSITNEAVDVLKRGDTVIAVIKVSDEMVAK
jgi:molybdopterin-binding protein